MQPLDVSFFKELKTYNQQVQCWLRRHNGRPVSVTEMLDVYQACLRALSKHCQFSDIDAEIKSHIIQTCIMTQNVECSYQYH